MVAAALALTACAGSTKFVGNKPNLQPADLSLMADCEDPVLVPNGPLTQVQVERYWSRDRLALAQCKDRHTGLTRFYKKRDQLLTTQKLK